jgi:hypothetical protein
MSDPLIERDHARLIRLLTNVDRALNELDAYLDAASPPVEDRRRTRLTYPEIREATTIRVWYEGLKTKLQRYTLHGMGERYACSHNAIWTHGKFHTRKSQNFEDF